MLTFADAFLQSYNAGLERRRQQEAATTLLGIISNRQKATTDALHNNELYDWSTNFDANNTSGSGIKANDVKLTDLLNSDLSKEGIAKSFSGDNSATPSLASIIQNKPAATSNTPNFLDLVPKRDYTPNVSFVPQQRQVVPEYNTNDKYSMMAQAISKGVPVELAMPFINNFYAEQKADDDKKKIESYIGNLPADKQDEARVMMLGNPYVGKLFEKPEDRYVFGVDGNGQDFVGNITTGVRVNGDNFAKPEEVKKVNPGGNTGQVNAQDISGQAQSLQPQNNVAGAIWYDKKFRELKARFPNVPDKVIYEEMTRMITGR